MTCLEHLSPYGPGSARIEVEREGAFWVAFSPGWNIAMTGATAAQATMRCAWASMLMDCDYDLLLREAGLT